MCFFTSTPPFSPLSFQSKHSTQTSFHTLNQQCLLWVPTCHFFLMALLPEEPCLSSLSASLFLSLSLEKVCGSEVNFALLRDLMCHICALCWGLLAAAVILMHWLEATEVFLSALLSKSIGTFNSLISTRSMADKVRARIWNIQIQKVLSAKLSFENVWNITSSGFLKCS